MTPSLEDIGAAMVRLRDAGTVVVRMGPSVYAMHGRAVRAADVIAVAEELPLPPPATINKRDTLAAIREWLAASVDPDRPACQATANDLRASFMAWRAKNGGGEVPNPSIFGWYMQRLGLTSTQRKSVKVYLGIELRAAGGDA